MTYNEAETRYYLIDPVLREKGYDDHQWLRLETPALWEVPEISLAGGLAVLKAMGKPVDVMMNAKGRLFAA